MKKIIYSLFLGLLFQGLNAQVLYVPNGTSGIGTASSTANIGIKTATPDVALHLQGGAIKITDPGGYPYGVNLDIDATIGDWAREFSFTRNGSGKLLSFGAFGNTDLIYGYIGGNTTGSTSYAAPWMVFKPNGHIGIGTAGPQARLHVGTGGALLFGTPSTEKILITTTENNGLASLDLVVREGTNNRRARFFLDDSSSEFGIEQSFGSGGMDFVIKRAGTNRFEVLDNGRVAIGGSSPGSSTMLHILNNTTTLLRKGEIKFDMGYVDPASGVNKVNWIQSGYYQNSNWDLGLGGVDYNSGKPLMMIKGDGNVGIGTKTPIGRLQIGSEVANGNNKIVFGKYEPSLDANLPVIHHKTIQTQGQSSDLAVGTRSAGGGIGFYTGGTSGELGADSNALRMFVGNDGAGIGVLPEVGYQLAVGGNIIAEEIKVRPQTEWPDYVFGDHYELQPLSELKTYIQNNQHLPGIPSAKEVEEQGGIELGDMNARLLEKIEELTLHLINQEERLKKLEEENKVMKALLKK